MGDAERKKVENEKFSEKVENEKKNDDNNQKSKNGIEPILKPKASIISTRSRRRSRRKRNKVVEEVNESIPSSLKFPETMMSFDLFDEQLDDQNDDDVVIEEEEENKNDQNADNINKASKEEEDDDIDMKENEKEKEPTPTPEDQCANDLPMEQEFEVLESSHKSKSESVSKSKSVSLDESDKNDSNELLSTIRSNDDKISGKKRKLDGVSSDENDAPKSKKLKRSELNENEFFCPLLIGYNAKIDNLFNMLPREIRKLVEKLPFCTIDELAKCEYNEFIKFLIETKAASVKTSVEWEVNQIKQALQPLIVKYKKQKIQKQKELEAKEKEKEAQLKELQKGLKEMSTTTSATENIENKNNQNDNVDVEDGICLDTKSKEMETRLNAICFEFEEHKNEWTLPQIARIHQVIGRLNSHCIESTAKEVDKSE